VTEKNRKEKDKGKETDSDEDGKSETVDKPEKRKIAIELILL